MKSLWKIVFIVSLFLMAACNETAGTGDESNVNLASGGASQGIVAEENTNQADANDGPVQANPTIEVSNVDLTAEIAKFPIDLDIAHVDYAKALHPEWDTLSNAKKHEIVADIKAAWLEMMGELNPGTMKIDRESLNRFFQFVRLSGGVKFQFTNTLSAISNHKAHEELDKIIDSQNTAALLPFLSELSEQVGYNLQLRLYILRAGKIYTLPFAVKVPTPEERQHFAEKIQENVKEALNLDEEQTHAVGMRMVDLLRSTVIHIKGPDANVCFLSFTLAETGVTQLEEEAGVEKFQVLDRYYGIARASSNPFTSR